MSAAAIFATSATAQTYAPLPAALTDLPPGLQHSADRVWSAICETLRPGSTELYCTDATLSASRWIAARSLRFLRKGLQTLESLGMIERIRRHGLRTIVVLARLKGRERPSRPAPFRRHAAAGKPLPEPPPKPHVTYNPQAYQPFTKPQKSTPEQLAGIQQFRQTEAHAMAQAGNCNGTPAPNSCISLQATHKTAPPDGLAAGPPDG